jgi:glycosyltransferase involved in cell wall biosynthesis
MNILFVHTSSFENCGGIGRVTEINARKFKELGHEVFFFVLKQGVTNRCFDFTQYFLKDNNYQNPSNSDSFRETVSALKIDIIINQSGVNTRSLAFFKAASLPDIKIITCYHGAIKSIYDNYPIVLRGNTNHKLLKKLFQIDFVCKLLRYNYKRKMINDLGYVIANSSNFVLLNENYIQELSLYSSHFDLKKVISINNPLQYSHDVNQTVEKEKRLLYVGRINFSEKRCDLLPLIWERVSKRFPDWHFDIVGDGTKLLELKGLFAAKKLKNVTFHGYTNPFVLFQKASILCLTSAIEGYGLVLVEAIENNVVPIAFDVSCGVSDALDNGRLGVLIPPFDFELYCATLEKLFLDPKYSSIFTENAKSYDFDSKNKNIYDKWLSIFAQNLN